MSQFTVNTTGEEMIPTDKVIELAREADVVSHPTSGELKRLTSFANLVCEWQSENDAGICMSLCSVIEEPHEFERCAEAIRRQE